MHGMNLEEKVEKLSEEDLHKKITFMSFASAISVVLIHAYWVFPESSLTYYDEMPFATKIAHFLNWIGNGYAVQFFFLLSGYLLFRHLNNKDALFRKLKSRVFSLVVPYVLWNVFYIFFWIIAVRLGWSDLKIDLSLTGLLWGIVTHKYFSGYWFIGNLIVYVTLTPVLYLISKKRGILIVLDIIMFGILLALSLNFFPSKIGDQFVFESDWFLCYLAGVNIAVFVPDIIRLRLDFKHKTILIWGGIILCILLTWILGRIWITRFLMRLGTILFFIIIGCSGISWDKFVVRKWMRKSFAIYSWHGMVCSTISKVVYRFLPDAYWVEVVDYLSYLFIGLATIMALDEIAKKMIPHIRSAFLGGRDV